MKLFRRFAAGLGVALAILAASIVWQVHKARTNNQKLVDEARVTGINAGQGDAKAEFELGTMFYYGRGVQQNYAQALQWYRKAADQGNVSAEYEIGHMYESGHGLRQDYSQAISWYRKAADQGDSRAQCGLASMYYGGHGVQEDRTKAVEWYRKAADGGFPRAEYDLGYMYEHGEGGQEDRAEAYRWYRKAAKEGDEDAQRVLGLRGAGLGVRNLVILIAVILGCLWALKDSQLLGRQVRHKQQRALDFAAIFGLIYVGMSLFADFHAFGSMITIGVFDFVNSAVVGVVIAVGVAILRPKSVALVLTVLSALFIGINLLIVAHHALGHFAMTVRGFWEANGLLIGISATLAIFLWRFRQEAHPLLIRQ